MNLIRCDPRVFARCPYKGTCISPEQAEFSEGSDCDLFNQRILNTPITNGDKIRMMSDMELATFLYTATRACMDRNCAACPIGEENCIVLLAWVKRMHQ